MSAEAVDASARGPRLVSLDQFRGYTVAGMFLVNFLGGFHVVPEILKHNLTYCSYADTIMPQFFFAVGFAFRLTFLKRAGEGRRIRVYMRALMRCLGLILVGIVVYHLDGHYTVWTQLRAAGVSGVAAGAFRSNVWQALVHIGVTSIWVLPIIGAGAGVRIGFMVLSSVAFLVLSRWFYFDWVMHNAWDGGPLGFMTWCIPTLAGSLTYDVVVRKGARRAIGPLFCWAMVLMAAGYIISCLSAICPWRTGETGEGVWRFLAAPPFFPPRHPVDIWTMSQRSASVSYMTFSAGLSAGVYALFVIMCDCAPLRAGLFRTFGTNALAAYVIHDPVAQTVLPFAPPDSPVWYVTCAFGVFFGIVYLFVRSLERRGLFLKL